MRILLTIFPYWDPMIPPMGITSLKSFLQNNGYKVKTKDFIVNNECLDLYNAYFKALRRIVPVNKHGNFFNIGHDVLQNHLMAYQNIEDYSKYNELVKLLVYNYFYVTPTLSDINELNVIINNFHKVTKKHILNSLEAFKPDILGATAFKCTLPLSIYAMKIAKEKYPSIKTVIGGGTFNESHAPNSPNFDTLLEYTKDCVDKYILGSGELLFLKYLKGELPDSQRVYSKEDINGEILCFEESDIPDFSDLDLNKYPCMAATASAGCIYDCSFCVAKKVAGGYRSKNPSQLIQEMETIHKLSNNQLFFMTDSLINPVIDNISEEFINSEISLYYDAYMKVSEEACNIENTIKWRRGGLYRVRLGTESGSQTILDTMNKGISVDQIKGTLSALAYAGIKTTTYWVIGHPGETEENFMETLNLIEEMKDDIYQAECNYFLYHYSQQGKSDEWAKHRIPLFPEEFTKMLVFKHWTLNIDPIREETFDRVHRFDMHCKKIGVPNPYTLSEYYYADQRWGKLHHNAVPSILEFSKRDKVLHECKDIKYAKYNLTKKLREEDFAF